MCLRTLWTLKLKLLSLWYSSTTKKREFFVKCQLYTERSRSICNLCCIYYSSFHPTSSSGFYLLVLFQFITSKYTSMHGALCVHTNFFCLWVFFFFSKIIPFVLDKPGCIRKKKCRPKSKCNVFMHEDDEYI